MGTLSFFLIVALFSYYRFHPKSKIALWKYTLSIPLIISSIYLFHLYANTFASTYNRAYIIAKQFRPCIIPAIISGFVIYFLLKKKLKNGGVTKFPKILVAFIIITAGLGIFQKHTEKSLERDLKEIAPLLEKRHAINEIRELTMELNKELPIYIGDGILIYNVVYNENKNDFITYFRETEVDKDDFTKEEIESYKIMLRDTLLRTSKNNPKNQSFVKARTTITQIYEDKYGKFLLSITLHPDEYE